MIDKIYDELTGKQNKTIFLFAGPCVIESKECVFKIAEKMKEITVRLGISYIFKASFDKANRTSIQSNRGPGIKKGLEILSEVKKRFSLPIITDIHQPEQAEQAAKVADILQIPAFLCRQTDLLIAAAKTGLPVNIKKAQFLAPSDMKNVVEKMSEEGNNKLFLCERGTSFGYNNLIVDMAGLVEMKKLGFPVVFDATHSVQKPGGNFTGGNREYVPYLARAAAAVGVDGFFMEVHPDPDRGFSDAANMIQLDYVENLLKQLQEIHKLAVLYKKSEKE